MKIFSNTLKKTKNKLEIDFKIYTKAYSLEIIEKKIINLSQSMVDNIKLGNLNNIIVTIELKYINVK